MDEPGPVEQTRSAPVDPGTDAPRFGVLDAFDEQTPLSEEIEEGRAPAILAYVPFGCFIALVRYRHNAFAVHHGKQGLFLTFCEMLAGLFLIPRLSEYFWITVVFASLASTVTGIYYALQGKDWSIPIVGKWFDEHMKI